MSIYPEANLLTQPSEKQEYRYTTVSHELLDDFLIHIFMTLSSMSYTSHCSEMLNERLYISLIPFTLTLDYTPLSFVAHQEGRQHPLANEIRTDPRGPWVD